MDKVTIDAFKVIGIAMKTSNVDNQALNDIGGLWQRFMSENLIALIPHKVDNRVYSIYTDYEGDHMKPYTVVLGCEVKNLDFIPEGMVGKKFSTNNYKKFTAKGNLQQGVIAHAWAKIWESNLPRAYAADFEIYGEKAQNPENAEVDIFISVQ